MKLHDLKDSGHWPTLLVAFLYFDVSFMVWTMLGPLAAQVGHSLGLSQSEKGMMVATPILGGAILRIVLGLCVDRFGEKSTGITAQCIVIAGLAGAWIFGLHSYEGTLVMGAILGFAGASFAVALPQASRWYPPQMQGLVLGIAGAGNMGVVIDSLAAPRLAMMFGWQNVFGLALIPAALALLAYIIWAREAPGSRAVKRLSDYLHLLRQKDTHWFCFYYTVSFGGFVGLASSLVLFFVNEYKLTPVEAGDIAAICTLVGAMARPFGGALADRFGGIRTLHFFYAGAAVLLACAAFQPAMIALSVCLFFGASACFGMANGAVFQLLPQRFRKEMGLMTGLVGCGGGIGGFLLAASLGWCKQATGNYSFGLVGFAAFVMAASLGLWLVKVRWRSTWGAVSGARV